MSKKRKNKIVKRFTKMLINLIGLLLVGGVFSFLMIEYLFTFTY